MSHQNTTVKHQRRAGRWLGHSLALFSSALLLLGFLTGRTLAQDPETKTEQETPSSPSADKLAESYDWYRIGELNGMYFSWSYHSQHAVSLKELYKEGHDLLIKVGAKSDVVELLDEGSSRVLDLLWKEKPDYKSWTKDEKGDWSPAERNVSAPTNYLKEIHQEVTKRGGVAFSFLNWEKPSSGSAGKSPIRQRMIRITKNLIGRFIPKKARKIARRVRSVSIIFATRPAPFVT
jgi:hypothetical protein